MVLATRNRWQSSGPISSNKNRRPDKTPQPKAKIKGNRNLKQPNSFIVLSNSTTLFDSSMHGTTLHGLVNGLDSFAFVYLD